MSPTYQTPEQEAKKNYQTGLNHLRKNNLQEAEFCIGKAIASDENNPEYWLKLGIIWGKMGRYSEAIEANTMALSIAPHSPDALYNLGVSHIQSGNEDEGISFLQKSYETKQSEQLAEQLADLFYLKQNYKSAGYYLLNIYKKKKTSMGEAYLYKLALCLFYCGEMQVSLELMINLTKKHPNNGSYISLLLDLYRRSPQTDFNFDSKMIVETLLKKDKVKFIYLRNPWANLFNHDPSYDILREVALHSSSSPYFPDINKLTKSLKTDFLCMGIQKGVAISAPVENVLTAIRKLFLLKWKEAPTWPDDLVKFLASLAVGCWYNDYIYFETNEEKTSLLDLKQQVIKLLKEDRPENKPKLCHLVSLLSCYMPLYEFCENINSIPIPKNLEAAMKPLIDAQYTSPQYEKSLIQTIPDFSTIDDKTSLSVQNMYKARPYPRWISSTIENIPVTLSDLTRGFDILVAGCGTGHEPAIYTNVMPEAHITAIDLSLPSIAYGKRMAIKLGYNQKIDFYHGDLVKIGELEKKFDFIASSGVLHHLEEPEKGLSAILQSLKPDGRLSISLYSKVARDYLLNPALEYIREKKYTSSTNDIRQFRQDIVMMSPDHPATRCASTGDFYFLSECNDLLFHVQEHRYTPQMIWGMADRHDLIPIHISMTNDRLKLFQDMFPNQSPLNPDLLAKFEAAHPKAFIEMYKIFFRKKDSLPDQPIDKLIVSGLL